jgi:RING finger/CHY zinc finger protein 1
MSVGCAHYERTVSILAPCCQKWYPCHRCHDEFNDQSLSGHEIDRYAIQSLRCEGCHLEQPLSDKCQNQTCQFAHGFEYYVCTKCCMFNTNPEKPMYHCDDCNICRLGNREDYFHCFTCQMCFDVKTQKEHKCNPAIPTSLCSICQDKIMTSRSSFYTGGLCGHMMCINCAGEQMIVGNFKCPICSKSFPPESMMATFWRQLDASAPPLADMDSEIHLRLIDYQCNDCGHKCLGVRDNFAEYHKCGECGSYNTSVTHSQYLGTQS